MKETIQVVKTVGVPFEPVWRAVAAIGGLDRWFPVIADCEVRGDGVGAVRRLTLAGGGEIKDRIEAIDHRNACLCYNRFESPFPVDYYIGTVKVRPIAANACEIDWTVEIDSPADSLNELAEFIREALSAGIDGMARDVSARTE